MNTIGGINTETYQESTLEYVKVTLPACCQIPLAGLTSPGLNNTPNVVVVDKTSSAQSIIDTGTTLLITTDSLALDFKVGSGMVRYLILWLGYPLTFCPVPCNTVSLLAPALTFASRSFTASSASFNLGPVSEGTTDSIAGLDGGSSRYLFTSE